MAVKQKAKKSAIPVIGSASAPIVAIEGIVAYGVYNGTVQLECGHNILVPGAAGEEAVETQILMNAHLRMSAQTAVNMIGALRLSIDLHKKALARRKAAAAKKPAAAEAE